ncbi:MAG: outer membrane protein transport protein [Pseudomonadota bacterium]|nr:outer membrane protein transport protein [Pseudomonadota bacterium]
MRKTQLLIALAAIGFAGSASATNGYFAHGVGVKSQSMGGAGIAYAEDGFGIGANPATLSQVKQGYAVGLSVFSPDRAASLLGGTGAGGANIPGGIGWQDGNRKDMFFIPEFAYVSQASNGLSYGVAVYGNGGMNVDYNRSIYDTTGDRTFTNMEQLFIAPTISKKINDQHTVAASLNLVYQTFEAGGLDMFTCYTPGGNCGTGAGAGDPGNHGKDSSTGVGVRLGWTGKMSDKFTVGAFYQPETAMSKFDKYNYLFAEHGKFNIPATYGLGMAVNATPKTIVLFDVVAIQYGDIKSLANPNNHTPGTTNLGEDDGKGFGWKDVTVYKLGVQHQMDDKTTLRAGWNYAKQPIANNQLDFNLLAPAVVENHLTLGVTRKLDKGAEVSVSIMHAFNNKVEGPMAAGTGTIHVNALEMSQNQIGMQYASQF